MQCAQCQKPFPIWWTNPETGKRHNLISRKFCPSCSPFGKHNTSPSLKVAETAPGGHRLCKQCSRMLPETEFHRCGARKSLQWWCKGCHATYAVERFRRIKREAIAYLGGKCKKCGYDKCPDAFDFHHRDPAEKEFTFAAVRTRSFKAIKAELDKCDLLCANCHRETHAGWEEGT